MKNLIGTIICTLKLNSWKHEDSTSQYTNMYIVPGFDAFDRSPENINRLTMKRKRL